MTPQEEFEQAQLAVLYPDPHERAKIEEDSIRRWKRIEDQKAAQLNKAYNEGKSLSQAFKKQPAPAVEGVFRLYPLPLTEAYRRKTAYIRSQRASNRADSDNRLLMSACLWFLIVLILTHQHLFSFFHL